MRHRKTSLLLVALFFGCATTPVGSLASAGIRNFHDVDMALSRGAQPSEAGVQALARRHTAIIVDLRPESEDPRAFNSEKAAANASSIEFKNFPLSNWLAPRAETVREVLRVLESATPAQSVFVHCQRGADRTGTIIAIYRIEHDCKTATEAIREAYEDGMGWWQFPMRHFIRKWYAASQRQTCSPRVALARRGLTPARD
jgi:protein tyrosine phosphatase (PTP) superfamily phosphohydrolase (DUF442 family)